MDVTTKDCARVATFGMPPNGTRGEWSIERKTVTKEQADLGRLRASFRDGRYTPEGEYVGLKRGGELIMSNTPDELRDFREAVRYSKGHVLIAGLGLGCVLEAVASKSEVDRVTVIEKSQDVIELAWEAHWKRAPWASKVEVICADIFTWKAPRGTRYGMAWFDVWDNICADNLTEMAKLHRRFGPRSDSYGSWARIECMRARR